MVAVEVLGALAHGTRLDAVALLLRMGGDGLAAGEVAQRLAVPQNTMSTHLRILSSAGLIHWERRSRNIIYRADAHRLAALTSFLRDECDVTSSDASGARQWTRT